MATSKFSHRIISGTPAETEAAVCELSSDYTVVMWGITHGEDGVKVTAILQSTHDLMRQAFNAQRGGPTPILRG